LKVPLLTVRGGRLDVKEIHRWCAPDDMKRGKFCNHSEAVKKLFFFCPRPFQDGSLSGTTLTGLVLFFAGTSIFSRILEAKSGEMAGGWANHHWRGAEFSILFLIFRHPFIIMSITVSSEGMY
jgi:hypothetical protein